MPASLTYPGVYVEELKSGVRPIVGVSTSVTAFIGAAKRGPINKYVRVLSFADFERRFGGLDPSSEMSYAVRQFFINGGSEALIVRITQAAAPAIATLLNDTDDQVLTLTAIDAGESANEVAIQVDYATSNPGSTFNLALSFVPEATPGEAVFETYRNLSMTKGDPRYAPDVITAESKLVTAVRNEPIPAAIATTKGVSRSADLSGVADVTTLVDGTHNTISVALNGQPPVKIALDKPAANTNAALRDAVKTKLQAAFGNANIDVAVVTGGGTKRLVITSQLQGETSSVRVTPGDSQDAARNLLLGPLFGGEEVDASAALRPKISPEHALLSGGIIAGAADLDNIPSAQKSFKVIIDGYQSDIVLDGPDLAGTLAVRLEDLATRIEDKVRAARPTNPAFSNFTAITDDTALFFSSGSRGAGSSIAVALGDGDTLASALRLTVASGADVSAAKGTDLTLAGGSETPLDPASSYSRYVGSRSKREGIYALEAADIFNLMVLAGVNDPGILGDAASYCSERRAFLIVDSSPTDDTPDKMETAIAGTAFPKTKDGAVYYPWVMIGDPLTGRLRTTPPSGTIAGVYARTDATRGVWKAPAGTEATLAGVQGVDYVLTDGENGILNPHGVNCIRLFPVFGPVSWGARTLQGDDQQASEWKYIPVRRLALFLEESLYRGTKWAVFEPNDEPLWSQLRLNLGAFMQNLFRQGAFQGQTPRDAYFVKCDRDTTTQNDIDLGVVNIFVGFAPLKPAEFVVIKFQQLAGQVRT